MPGGIVRAVGAVRVGEFVPPVAEAAPTPPQRDRAKRRDAE